MSHGAVCVCLAGSCVSERAVCVCVCRSCSGAERGQVQLDAPVEENYLSPCLLEVGREGKTATLCWRGMEGRWRRKAVVERETRGGGAGEVRSE